MECINVAQIHSKIQDMNVKRNLTSITNYDIRSFT